MLNGYNRLLATVAATNDQRENLPAGRFVFISLDVALLKMTRLTGMTPKFPEDSNSEEAVPLFAAVALYLTSARLPLSCLLLLRFQLRPPCTLRCGDLPTCRE
jgi:hypothetical protein